MTSRLPVVAIATLIAAWPLAADQALSTRAQQAQAQIQRQQFDSAAALLQTEVETAPAVLPGWVLLGIARHGAGNHAAALEANRKAVALNPAAPTPLYNGGLELALLGQLDEAFEWMSRAKATGRLDMTALWNDPDASALRADARFGTLLPSAEEYDDPFVEPVKILREWRGETPREQFGWIARDAGDVDGDGIHDAVTSSPTWGPNGSQAGKVFLYSSGTGELLWAVTGQPGEQFGLGVEAAGDVNGDGVPDVVAGAPLRGSGRAVVLSGVDGSTVLELTGTEPGERFGRRVSDVGDVNGDGRDDLLVTAPFNASNTGRAGVYSGADGVELIGWTGERTGDQFGDGAAARTSGGRSFFVVGAPNAGPGNRGRTYVYEGLQAEPKFVIEADPTGAALGGYFVSVVGDVDADGTPDIYAADFSDNGAAPGGGKIFVHSGADGTRLHAIGGTTPGEGLGIGPADAGDLDGDGYDDLVIGAWQHRTAAQSGGKTYLHSGRDGALLGAITGKVAGETLGFDATGIGDVDADGVPDLLLTSAWSSINGYQSGRMYILSGASALDVSRSAPTPGVGSAASAGPRSPSTGPEIIQAMYDRYADSWYETLTFVQKTTNYDQTGQVANIETWYESMRVPGELRIDVQPVGTGRILLFRNDSLWVRQGEQVQPGRPLVHGLLLMGFDVYGQPVEETLAKLTSIGVDVSKSHDTTWQDRPVHVVGAIAGDMTSNQFWIDQERLVFVRQLNGTNEVQFNDYEPIGGGWIAPEVRIMRNGQIATLEEYSEMKVGMTFEDGVFDPVRWVRPGWIGGD